MAEETRGERTEQPTPRRLEEERRKGKIAVSKDLTAALSTAAALGVLAITGASMLQSLRFAVQASLSAAANPARGLPMTLSIAARALVSCAPVIGAVVVTAALVGLIQTGGYFGVQTLAPDPSRLNPFPRLKDMFGIRSIVDLLRAVLRVALAAAVIGWAIAREIPRLSFSAGAPVEALLAAGGVALTRVLACAAGVLIVLGAVEYGVARWRFMREMRMSPREIRDEHKEQEGDPLLRGRRRQRARDLARNRMIAAAANADVVVTNPTHYAVALKYEAGTMGAPRVLARGVDALAARIREAARKHGVPVLRNPLLARTLYRIVKVGGFVPPDLYEAVAVVLAHVYRWRSPATLMASPEGTSPELGDSP